MGDAWTDLPLALEEGSGRISASNLINMMLLKMPPEDPYRFAAISVPKLASNPITSGSGSMRGMIVHADTLWFVRGTQLYFSTNGTSATLVGTVSGTNLVRMTGAGAGQIAIVDGGGNEYTATTSAVSAVTPPAGDFADVTFMDGYIIATRAGTDEFYISALDGTTFGALDFSTADAISDTLVGCMASNRDLFLFGKKHIEIWADVGASPFPFVRQQPAVIERGCVSAKTIQKADGIIYFLGNDKRVYRLNGYAPEPISTEAVERLLNGSSTSFDSMVTSIYMVSGQLIYAIQFNSTQTLEYNITTGVWHRRSSYIGFRTNYAVSAVVKAYHAGDGPSAVTGVYSIDTANVDSTLSYSITCPYFDRGGRRVFESEVELQMGAVDAGGGTVSLAYRDADDGVAAVTHSTVSLGLYRINWSRVGSFRKREHAFTFATPSVPIVVYAARARLDVGL